MANDYSMDMEHTPRLSVIAPPISESDRPLLTACQQVRETVFIQGQSVPREIEQDGHDELCTHYLLQIDGVAVATLRLRPVDAGMKLERMAVLPEYRGHGYATCLIAAALSDTRCTITTHAQVHSIGLYQRMGFVQEPGTVFLEAGIEHVSMRHEGEQHMSRRNTIIIAGAGVFGTAVAERLAWNKDNRVILYSIEDDVVEDINRNHRNTKYFPTRFLNASIVATGNIEIFSEADYVMLVIPSKAIVPFSNQIRPLTKEDCMVINLAKGMSDEGAFITEQIPFRRTASMKGPTFAIEVINGFPSSFTFGGQQEDFEQFKSQVLPDTGLYLDFTKDIRGVELMSVLKNMYAIAIGLVSGKYNSPNVDFMIYTKCVNEMRRFLKLFHCEQTTIFGYCGLGDLGLTSLNDLSRNRTLGMLMGKGFTIDQTGSSTVIEGYRTIKLMGEMTREKGVAQRFPVVQALYRLMFEGETLNEYLLTVFA